MKDFIRFIPYWWNNLRSDGRITTAVVAFVLFFGSTALLGGPKAVAFLFLGIVAIGILWVMAWAGYNVYENVSISWKKYKALRDQEAQDIVDRLNGVQHSRFRR